MSAVPSFSFSTTAEEVAAAFSQEIRGKIIVTGTSLNGIGFETDRVIAKHANLVIITGYNDERLKLSEDVIKKDVPTANIRCHTLDLSSLASVRKTAAKLTVNGLESQIGTDHVGPFLFTKLLAKKLIAAKSSS
ncbi:hypothetical protein B0H14DRAFT_3525868 [Mycena olivaceomarginata]|nr:hypothetical protein B0H14DRAFT_3525868 [Mycena olivaceomarginata]